MDLKRRAQELYTQGLSYSDINTALNTTIPKATLSYWTRGIVITPEQETQKQERTKEKLIHARKRSLESRRESRDAYMASVKSRNLHLRPLIEDRNIGKIVLGILYITEGSKNSGGSLTFGNSNQGIISLYLSLLRTNYVISESKFRCTVMARADQDIARLEEFWRAVTDIPKEQFYAARIDPRTKGKPTRKLDYMGVCRIDYFSADLLYEIMSIGDILSQNKGL